MDSRLEKIVSECTQPLADDPELELDIAQELRSHLMEKCEELKREGLSEENAIEKAAKEFGDSMEISESFYHANLQRFQFRAKLRLAAKHCFSHSFFRFTGHEFRCSRHSCIANELVFARPHLILFPSLMMDAAFKVFLHCR